MGSQEVFELKISFPLFLGSSLLCVGIEDRRALSIHVCALKCQVCRTKTETLLQKLSEEEKKRYVSIISPRYEKYPLNPTFCRTAITLAARVEKALQNGSIPSLMDVEATGGVWVIKGEDEQPIAIFKPADEEAGVKNAEDRARKGIEPGEGAVREHVVSYLSNLSGLAAPVATMVSITHDVFEGTKTGSLQEYVVHENASWDMGPGKFAVDDVQRIGLSDLRFLNTDRHGGNMVVTSEGTLVPIDHAYCLPGGQPGKSSDDVWVEWLTWPQAKAPLSEVLKKNVLEYDIESNSAFLRESGISESAVKNFIIVNTILKVAVQRDIDNLKELAMLCCRTDPKVPCLYERIAERLSEEEELNVNIKAVVEEMMAM